MFVHGAWLSLVERSVRDAEVTGSSPVAPTKFMKKKLHLYYSGKVQGIGFRYTVLDIALDLKVYGWVKNLNDGRVEVLAESEEDTLNVFLEQINQHFSRYIIDTAVEWFPASGEFRNFQVQS